MVKKISLLVGYYFMYHRLKYLEGFFYALWIERPKVEKIKANDGMRKLDLFSGSSDLSGHVLGTM